MARKTVAERLLARLRDELGLELPGDAVVRRTGRGAWQRAQGAWAWRVETEAGGLPLVGGRLLAIGAPETMAEILRAGRLGMSEDVGDVTVFEV